MPLFYASARQAYETGEPILRRLDLQYPKFKEAMADDQFLIGDSLLVAPIVGGKDAEVVPAAAFPQPLDVDYFANKDLQGEPVAHEQVKSINFSWGTTAPNPKLPVDFFSARYTGRITVPQAHPYRLQVTADDGVRMWIDGKLQVDKWGPQDSVTTEAPIDLAPGSTHDVKIEYMELEFYASLRLRWRPMTAVSENSTRECWIPPGRWTDVWSGAVFTGPRTVSVKAPLEQMPMFLETARSSRSGPTFSGPGKRIGLPSASRLCPATAISLSTKTTDQASPTRAVPFAKRRSPSVEAETD